MKKKLLDLWYRIAALFVVLSILGCQDPVTPTIPDDVPGKCSAMCEKLRSPDYACPEGQPTERGTPCETSCEGDYSLGYLWVPGTESDTPVCVIKADGLAELRQCHVKCRKD